MAEGMKADSYDIRPLTTLAEMAEVEQLQKTIWEIGDLEVMPVHALHAIQHNGGALIGALTGGKMVGFVLGIMGTSQRTVKSRCAGSRTTQIVFGNGRRSARISGIRALVIGSSWPSENSRWNWVWI